MNDTDIPISSHCRIIEDLSTGSLTIVQGFLLTSTPRRDRLDNRPFRIGPLHVLAPFLYIMNKNTIEFRMKTICIFASALLIALQGCSTDSTPVIPVATGTKPGVYILNEGNFQRANASLSYYVPDAGTVIADIFRQENGRELGDTGNSLTEHQGRVYIVVNGSNRIEVIEHATKRWIKTITLPPGASPRHIVFDDRGRGFISHLYTNDVSVYDDSMNAIIGRIPVGPNPEQLLVAGGKLFVTNSGLGAGSDVSVIDLSSPSFTVLATVKVGDNPTAIATSQQGKVVVLCTGAYNDFQDPNDDTPGMLYELNTESMRATDSLVLGGHPQRLVMDASGDFYSVLEDGIMKVLWTARQTIPKFIPGAFYSVFYHRSTNMLYVADPLDYVQPGRVHIYGMTGLLQRSFTVGIIPGAMLENP